MIMNKIEELKQRLIINKDMIFQELIDQAELFYQVSEKFSLAASMRDEAKSKVDKAINSAKMEIYKEYEKATKDQVEAAVAESKGVLEAEKYFRELKKNCNDWDNLVKAFEMRGAMLRKTADLLSSKVFGDTTIDMYSKGAKKELAKKGMEEIAKLRKPLFKKV